MRFIKTILTSAGMLVASAASALQDPTIKVDVQTSPTHTVWYANPVWLAIGGIVALLIIVLAIFAARSRREGSNTTVVR